MEARVYSLRLDPEDRKAARLIETSRKTTFSGAIRLALQSYRIVALKRLKASAKAA